MVENFYWGIYWDFRLSGERPKNFTGGEHWDFGGVANFYWGGKCWNFVILKKIPCEQSEQENFGNFSFRKFSFSFTKLNLEIFTGWGYTGRELKFLRIFFFTGGGEHWDIGPSGARSEILLGELLGFRGFANFKSLGGSMFSTPVL